MFAALFLFKKGKLQTYLDLCHYGNIGKYSTLFEAAMAKNAIDLEPEWRAFIADIKKTQSSGPQMPQAEIFASRKKFDEFAKKNPQLQLALIKGAADKGVKPDDNEKPNDYERPAENEKPADSDKVSG
jgi:hypothetical protein